MLINLSYTPSANWSDFQINKSIEEFESINDLDLPKLDPNLSEKEIISLSESLIEKCVKLFSNADKNNAVYIVADPIFTFFFAKSLLERGFRCISPSFNEVKSDTANIKEFVRYWEYRLKY
ncbi:MAG: hypothetical protein OQJ81_05570 [Melioribacteraceae bacterium]|nr:hypothetical protein [Melioribacteraceae bacterium]